MKSLRLKNHRVHERRIDVINRLKNQLKGGVKTARGLPIPDLKLTEKDEKRIKKEIAILNQRTGK